MKKGSNADRPDYRLLIAPHFNERTRRFTTRIALETVKPFAAFRYALNVEEHITENAITYKVVGLSAPTLSLPSSGPASFSTEHEALSGRYTVSVEGLDGRISTVGIRIGPRQVKVTNPVDCGSIDVITDEALWQAR